MGQIYQLFIINHILSITIYGELNLIFLPPPLLSPCPLLSSLVIQSQQKE